MKSQLTFSNLDIDRWRAEEFDGIQSMIYLDHAAMSPLPNRVKQALIDFHRFRAERGAAFAKWWSQVEKVRVKVAHLIGAQPDEIAFVNNTSMGINIAAQGLRFEPGDNVIISDLEFPANVYPWLHLQQKGVEVRFIRNYKGQLRLSDVENLMDHRTKVLSLSFVEAGNGFKNDLMALSRLCKENRTYFVVDAIQGIGVHPLDVKEIGIDFLVSGFYKWLFGPDGLAFIYCSEKILEHLHTPFVGWASMKHKFQYTEYLYNLHPSARRWELGNMNFSAIQGAGKALDLIEELGVWRIYERVMDLTNYLRKGLKRIPSVRCLSEFPKENLSQITLIDCPNVSKVFSKLVQQKIIVNQRNGLRISPHFYNTQEELDRFLEVLENSI